LLSTYGEGLGDLADSVVSWAAGGCAASHETSKKQATTTTDLVRINEKDVVKPGTVATPQPFMRLHVNAERSSHVTMTELADSGTRRQHRLDMASILPRSTLELEYGGSQVGFFVTSGT
jgi:hypothetical protein